MLKIPELQIGGIYKLRGRNFDLGVWEGHAFIGIRHKCGHTYLDRELHHDSDPNFGTAFPTEKVGQVPEDIVLSVHSIPLGELLSHV
jgi:hypothetical protein